MFFFLCQVVKIRNHNEGKMNTLLLYKMRSLDVEIWEMFFLCKVVKMRKDLEEINIQQESTVLSLKKKHQVGWVWLELKLNDIQIYSPALQMIQRVAGCHTWDVGTNRPTWKVKSTVSTFLYFWMCCVEVSLGCWSNRNWDKRCQGKNRWNHPTAIKQFLVRLQFSYQSLIQHWERQRQYQTWNWRDQNCVWWSYTSQGNGYKTILVYLGSVCPAVGFWVFMFSTSSAGLWKKCDLVLHFSTSWSLDFVFTHPPCWHTQLFLNIAISLSICIYSAHLLLFMFKRNRLLQLPISTFFADSW